MAGSEDLVPDDAMLGAAPPSHDGESLAGADDLRIPGYRILGRLGEGGMGTVYRALQESLQREVALKVVSRQLAGRPQAVAAFLREARTAAQVSHPNVITVFDVGQVGETVFMALEFMAGGDAWAKAEAAGGRLGEAEALTICRDACRGLAAIHDADLLHRDVKPQNIFLHKHGARLGDLGLAAGSDARGKANATVGTPHFMPPEQAQGLNALDPRADIYSLGATLFALTCGRPPFDGANSWAVVSNVLKEPHPDPRQAGPVSEATAQIIDRCLAKDPAHRFQSAEDLLQAIRAILTEDVRDTHGRPRTQLISGRLMADAGFVPTMPQVEPPAVADSGLPTNEDGTRLADVYSTTLDDPQYYRPPGTVVGPFRIRAALGETGTGFAYQAVETETQRPLHLELLRPEYGHDSAFIEWLNQLRQKLLLVLHPNVTPMVAIEEHDGQWCIAHEHVADISLAAQIAAEGPPPWEEAVTIVRECLDGLQALHEAGVIHRAVEPGNVFIGPDGVPRLGPPAFDPMLVTTNYRKTQSSAWLVAMAHQSPEQVLGERAPDERSDIYGLGALLYTVISGRVPFAAESSFDLYHAVIAGQLRPLRRLAPDLPEPLYELVERAMAQKPEDRFADTEALKSAAMRVGIGLRLKQRIKGLAVGHLASEESLTDLLALARICPSDDPDLEDLKKALALIALRAASSEGWQALERLFPEVWIGRKARQVRERLEAERWAKPTQTLSVAMVGGDFPSITEAVAAARPGARILVGPGTYNETVVIDKPLALIGEGLNSPVTLISDHGTPLTIANCCALIARLAITGTAPAGTEGAPVALLVENGRPLVLNSQIQAAGQAAILVRGRDANPFLADCRVNQCQGLALAFTGRARGVVSHCDLSENGAQGLAVLEDARPEITSCRVHGNRGGGGVVRGAGATFRDCVFSTNGKQGLLVRGGQDVVFERCRVHSNRGAGLACGEGGSLRLDDCELANNQAANCYVVSGAAPRLRNCQLVKGKAEGLHVAQDGAGEAIDCTISSNMGPGIAIAGGARPEIKRCVVEHGRAWGIIVAAGAGGSIEDTTLRGEGDKALSVDPAAKIFIR